MDARRVLVVEADAEVRARLAASLAANAAEAVFAADGDAALEALRRGAPPAVVLVDLRVPRLGGASFLAALRADRRFDGLPVITTAEGCAEPGCERPHRAYALDDVLDIVLSLLPEGREASARPAPPPARTRPSASGAGSRGAGAGTRARSPRARRPLP